MSCAPAANVLRASERTRRPLMSNSSSVTVSSAGSSKWTREAPAAGFGRAASDSVCGSSGVTAAECGSQPMSRKSACVRSTLLVRSLFTTGSMSRFGIAEGSQCEMLAPDANGFGA